MEERERGGKRDREKRQRKERQTDRAFPTCLTPVPFLLSTIVGIRSGSWKSSIQPMQIR
jgi:hypothetical protein